ncbi:MarR family transcriptional regulator [Arthrobacter sp. SRS-W-1-2016]|uniref:MarR family winged helix-turn-helix transcriptional regulator n=1 Tax=Arthrobacter TaxID=1663 RepID=UPI000990D399|nr:MULTISPECIES: MarR family transcriptional regulator [Arthrobacter]MDQ0209523.1 DNA-binding MarR family transcriptional regulator [Arthrobacter bambusae]MDQ0234151.1 DNA-binding MarR family transcriptional regulator [Arthrobacter bambusae]OOP62758.1 MarR family transcriptional regulator [Arthrobacter sp. SRS-W-1-2016]
MPDIERWPTGRLLSTAARLVEHAWDENLREIGLTHAGVIALEVLAVTGPITQTVLAQIVRVQAQTMGQTLSRLETHGHISRRRSPEDRRVHVVSLTDVGKEALERAVESEQQVLAQVSIDTSMFRQELKVLVRELAGRQAPGGDNASAPLAAAARED